MRGTHFLALCVGLGVAAGLSRLAGEPAGSPGRIIVNPSEIRWESTAQDAKGSESAVLRQDPGTGAIELFARYPAGHVFPPHWHSANERLLLLEGRLSLENGAAQRFLEPGGFAYLPAKQAQRMACVSKTRCAFYVYWDGKLDFNPADN
jgi:anti-sigma factor ChrR (cupin superfamily)